MKVQIDHNSGFCFGVVYAIEMAEDELKNSNQLFVSKIDNNIIT